MTVSGENGPAGLFYIEPDANAIEIQPDLVPDLINFYNQYKSVELKAVTEGSGKGITSDLPDGNTVTVGGELFPVPSTSSLGAQGSAGCENSGTTGRS